MKALILSAGFGTRLYPYTELLPKPLFPISGQPIIDIIIEHLAAWGFTDIYVNTHHLHKKIEAFLSGRSYSNCRVTTRYEKEILDTGGGIKNFSDIWGTEPFLVINSDIYSDIHLGEVYNYHLTHAHPVTMVMHNVAEFNNVAVDGKGHIRTFRTKECPDGQRLLAFAGIHIIDPLVLEYIPPDQKYGIIPAYQEMLEDGHIIASYIPKAHRWTDIGTPQKYKEASVSRMAENAFQKTATMSDPRPVQLTPLKGDGSDRRWTRLTRGDKSLIMVDHGIREQENTLEVDAFVSIGTHLYNKKLPVPRIILHDRFSGLAVLEDLGDLHLEQYIKNMTSRKAVIAAYQRILDRIIRFSIDGFRDFSPSFTYQTESYSKEMILKYECRYFLEAFLGNYLKEKITYLPLEKDFTDLSEKALEGAFTGLMHRDMQSRNIMVKNDEFYFIDFQGARKGPIQYDIASLLIDPYVSLDEDIQEILFDYAVSAISKEAAIDEKAFRESYTYLKITRNLQMLGAFGYLTMVKNKTHFESCIPQACRTLKINIEKTPEDAFPELKKIVELIYKRIY